MRKGMMLIIILCAVVGLTACKPNDITATLSPSLDTIEVGTAWTDAGCTTTGTSCLKIDGTVNTDVVGEYTLYYEATDGRTSIYLMRVVTVVDTTKPSITLNPGVDTVVVGSSWIDAGCIATDNYDDTVTCTTTTSTVDTANSGNYSVLYTATDTNGNTATLIRYVYVLD